mmetsp:Transcript_34449/g.108137  ORF Transcript_34449/g.108137 Transcript_34449/m.108137 type:complete len:194 (-) Transcript_34449:1225-1806(-)
MRACRRPRPSRSCSARTGCAPLCEASWRRRCGGRSTSAVSWRRRRGGRWRCRGSSSRRVRTCRATRREWTRQLSVRTPSAPLGSSQVLRALVRDLEGLADEETPLIDVPHAIPLVYSLDADLQPIPSGLAKAPLRAGWYMADPDRLAASQKSIREEVDCRLGEAPCDAPPEECFMEGEPRPPGTPEWVCEQAQ